MLIQLERTVLFSALLVFISVGDYVIYVIDKYLVNIRQCLHKVSPGLKRSSVLSIAQSVIYFNGRDKWLISFCI